MSRKTVEQTAAFLAQNGIDAMPYHAGLDAGIRARTQARFLRDEGVVIVATIAFGMGINKPDVRSQIEEYQNEQGETRHSPRVQWINRKGGFLNKEATMNEGAAAAFGARMRGLVLKSKEKNPQPAKPDPAKAAATRNVPDPDPNNGAEIDDVIPF